METEAVEPIWTIHDLSTKMARASLRSIAPLNTAIRISFLSAIQSLLKYQLAAQREIRLSYGQVAQADILARTIFMNGKCSNEAMKNWGISICHIA